MTKTHKAVLSTLAVLCLLFMGSGVAQAQECVAPSNQCWNGSRRGHYRGCGGHRVAVRATGDSTSFGFNQIPSRCLTSLLS